MDKSKLDELIEKYEKDQEQLLKRSKEMIFGCDWCGINGKIIKNSEIIEDLKSLKEV